MSEEEMREAVEEAKAPGTFNIVNILKDRGYPKDSISIFIDEDAAYRASAIKQEIEDLDKAGSSKKADAKRVELNDALDEARQEMAKAAYAVHIEGISEGKREELYATARKKYPIEYEADNSVQSILSGNSRVEKESPERDSLFTDLLWQAHIKKIVDPNGDEQTEFPYGTIREMRGSLPISAIVKINDAIERIRTATAVFIMETGEDFLAKP